MFSTLIKQHFQLNCSFLTECRDVHATKKQGRIFVAFNWLLIFSIDLHNPRKKSIWFVLLVTCTSFGPRAIFTRHIYIYIWLYTSKLSWAKYKVYFPCLSVVFVLFVTSNFKIFKNILKGSEIGYGPKKNLWKQPPLLAFTSFLHAIDAPREEGSIYSLGHHKQWGPLITTEGNLYRGLYHSLELFFLFSILDPI
jgi:energy-coupling factor transporter transmembrane protein EcfT